MNLIDFIRVQNMVERDNWGIVESERKFCIIRGHGQVKTCLGFWELHNNNIRENEYFMELKRHNIIFIGSSLATLSFRDKKSANRGLMVFLEMAVKRKGRRIYT